MIAQSRSLALACLCVAAAAHVGLLYGLNPREEVLMEASAGAAVAKLGNSFADFVQGTQQPEDTQQVEEAEEATEVTEPEEITKNTDVEAAEETPPVEVAETAEIEENRETPEPVEQTETKAVTAAATPAVEVTTEARTTETEALAVLNAPDLVESPKAELLIPSAPVPVLTSPEISTATSASPVITAAEPVPVTPVAVTEAMPVPALTPTELSETVPEETIEAVDGNSEAVLRSPRPMARPKDLKIPERVKNPPKRVVKPKPPRPNPGNSTRSTVVGVVGGEISSSPNTQGTRTTTRTTSSGNAAASNYPGKVMRCVSRASRARTNASGTASVGFSVSGNGRITGVYLAGSSGNGQLDSAAVRAVRSVGRCPPPPPGARTSFSVQVRGR